MPQTNIPALLSVLQIPTKVHSVYLVGSRLWGTHSKTSDFDLLIVVADPLSSTEQFQKSQHKGQYDATLLSETSFREQVKAGSLIETISCLIPNSDECVLINDDTQRRGLNEGAHLQTMRIWAEERGRKDREKAMKFWAKGGEMREKGWKFLQHTIAAECVLQGLEKIVEEDGISLRDVHLTQATLQELVAIGRQDSDRAWLGLDWDEVQELHRQRITTVGTML
ncbi:hypothetical protein C8R44DRAFT_766253 [Mycena epipterygia]|nr:hypothetical protein C8R44DRAFT_766253 [Mycena epipterygia]